MTLYVSPDGTRRLADLLTEGLSGSWTSLRFCVAYAKLSGLDQVYDPLSQFLTDGNYVSGVVGIDQHGTSFEALAALSDLADEFPAEFFICYSPRSLRDIGSPTFHPKLWLFERTNSANLIIGSGNLTQAGLYVNSELGISLDLDPSLDEHRSLLEEAVGAINTWSDTNRGDVHVLSEDLLADLVDRNLVLTEDELRRSRRSAVRNRLVTADRSNPNVLGSPIFEGVHFERPPPTAHPTPRRQPSPETSAEQALPSTPGQDSVTPAHDVFYIHLNMRNKTEIFLAKTPLKEDPPFLDLPFTGRTEPRREGNPPQPHAQTSRKHWDPEAGDSARGGREPHLLQ